MIVSLIICGVIVAVGVLAPDFFTYIFLNPDEEILSMSADAVRTYFIGFLFMAANMVYICYFQAIVKWICAVSLFAKRLYSGIDFRVYSASVFRSMGNLAGLCGGRVFYIINRDCMYKKGRPFQESLKNFKNPSFPGGSPPFCFRIV